MIDLQDLFLVLVASLVSSLIAEGTALVTYAKFN